VTRRWVLLLLAVFAFLSLAPGANGEEAVDLPPVSFPLIPPYDPDARPAPLPAEPGPEAP